MKNINIQKFTLPVKDAYTPKEKVLTGVYHENGFEIACNKRTIVVVKTDYDKSMESKVIAKDGTEIKGNYPDYKQLDWNKTNADTIEFTDEKIKFIKDSCKQYGKNSMFCINDAWFYSDTLKKFVEVMEKAKTKTAFQSLRTLFFETDEVKMMTAMLIENKSTTRIYLNDGKVIKPCE